MRRHLRRLEFGLRAAFHDVRPWRRHSDQRPWRRAISSKLWASRVRCRRERDPARELLDHRALTERPVGEVCVAQPDLAAPASAGLAERTAQRFVELAAAVIARRVGASVISFPFLRRIAFGPQPAGREPLVQQRARLGAQRRPARPATDGAGRPDAARVSHRGRAARYASPLMKT